MKKHQLSIALLLTLILIAPACASVPQEKTAQDEPNQPDEIIQDEPIKEQAAKPVEGPCNHILFPLNNGNNWVYELDSIDENGNPTKVEYAWSVSGSSDSGITLGTLFYDSGTVVSTDIACNEGMIQNFPVTVSNIVLGDTEGSIQYDFVSGKFLPSESELESENWGNTWETIVNSSGTISASYDGETVTIILEDSPITMDWQIKEKDVSITVPAGTFENAVLVNQTMVYEIKSLKIETGDIPFDISTTITTNSDFWFVPNLGLVKTEVKSTSVKLFGSEFPWDATGANTLKSSNLLDN